MAEAVYVVGKLLIYTFLEFDIGPAASAGSVTAERSGSSANLFVSEPHAVSSRHANKAFRIDPRLPITPCTAEASRNRKSMSAVCALPFPELTERADILCQLWVESRR